MKNLLLVALGVVIGFAVADRVAKTPQGQAFFAGVSDRAASFSSAVIDGYRTREAELRDALAEAEDALATAVSDAAASRTK